MPLVLEELQECVAADRNTEQEFEKNHLSEVVNSFVKTLPGTEQKVFLCRYWYMDSIGSISQQFGFSESKRKKENSQGSVGRGGDLGRLHMHRDDAAERDFE